MNEAAFKEVSKRLRAANKLISELDPAVRGAAFDILRPYIENEDAEVSTPAGKKPPAGKKHTSGPAGSVEAFFGQFDHKKPADNVLLISAWFYSQYGLSDLSAKQINEYADSTGLTIPKRPDNTLRQARRKGKGLFRQTTKGWQPTVSGEAYLKETYQVKKGTAKPEEPEE